MPQRFLRSQVPWEPQENRRSDAQKAFLAQLVEAKLDQYFRPAERPLREQLVDLLAPQHRGRGRLGLRLGGSAEGDGGSQRKKVDHRGPSDGPHFTPRIEKNKGR